MHSVSSGVKRSLSPSSTTNRVQIFSFTAPRPSTRVSSGGWGQKAKVTIQKPLWVRFSVVSPSSFTWLGRARERALSRSYRGPAHAAPQRPLVAAACASPAALSARRCQQFPRLLPLERSSSCWSCGTCWHRQLCQLRVSAVPSPSSPTPLLLRGRTSTPSLLSPLQLSQAHLHRRLESCTPSRF